MKTEITHNISRSKGWGRYKIVADGRPVVTSATGNEWLYAGKEFELPEGTEFSITLETSETAKKSGRENRQSETHRLVADASASAKIGYWDGLEVVVSGARAL